MTSRGNKRSDAWKLGVASLAILFVTAPVFGEPPPWWNEIVRLYSERSNAKTPADREKATDALVVSLTEKARDKDFQSRCIAVVGMHDLDDPRIVPCLIVALRDEHTRVRQYAADKLHALADPRAVEPLIDVFANDESDEVRATAGTALARMEEPRALDIMIASLKNKRLCVRITAVNALDRLGTARAVAALETVANDPNEYVRNEARYRLDHRKPRTIESLLREMPPHQRGVRVGGPPLILEPIIALGRCDDERAVDPLIQALENDDWRVQWRAGEALANKDDPRAAAALLSAAKEKRLAITAGGHEWLIRNGDPETQEALIEALAAWGDVRMVRNCLYCGNAALAEAAREYASRSDHIGPLPEKPKDPIRWASLASPRAD